MSKDDGDFVIVLSSDLIAEVMGRYFNQEMFMMPVKVVDLQATESGYAFTLGFASELDHGYEEENKQYSPGSVMTGIVDKMRSNQDKILDAMTKRDKKGRFTKGDKYDALEEAERNELPN